MTVDDLLAALPTVALGAGALLLFALPRWLRADERSWMLLGAILATSAAAAATLLGGGADGLEGLLRRDGASAFIALMAGTSAAVALVIESADRAYDARRGARAVARVLLMACGATLAGAAGDLITALVGIALICLAAPSRRALVAPLLFAAGAALLFADAGSTRLGSLGGASSPVGQAGIALLLSALAIVAGLVPFHLLTPDLDGTAPPAVAAFAGVIGRLGAFALLLRAAGTITASGLAQPDWSASIAVLAALTMVVGVLLAVARSSVRGVLAFLVVSQGGTLAVALASGIVAGPAIAFALVVLVTTVLGASAVVAQLARGDPRLGDLRGLARRRPLLVIAFGVLLLGLAGLPPSGGFVARVYLFEAAIGAQLAWLVIVGALTTVVAAACCFRLFVACLGESENATRRMDGASAVALVAAAVTLLIGVLPVPLIDAVQGVRF